MFGFASGLLNKFAGLFGVLTPPSVVLGPTDLEHASGASCGRIVESA